MQNLSAFRAINRDCVGRILNDKWIGFFYGKWQCNNMIVEEMCVTRKKNYYYCQIVCLFFPKRNICSQFKTRVTVGCILRLRRKGELVIVFPTVLDVPSVYDTRWHGRQVISNKKRMSIIKKGHKKASDILIGYHCALKLYDFESFIKILLNKSLLWLN